MKQEEAKKLKTGDSVMLRLEGIGQVKATVVAVGPTGHQVHVKASFECFIDNEHIERAMP